MTRLDTIDRRTDPKAWLDERARIKRQRDLRLECITIARRLQRDDVDAGARLLVAWVNQPMPQYADIRLECLRKCWRVDVATIGELLDASDALLAFATEADDE